MTRKIKFIPIGGTDRAVETYKAIIQRSDIEIPLLLIMRGYEDEHRASEELAAIAQKNGVKTYVLDKLTKEIVEECINLNPDMMLGIGVWRSMLPSRLLNSIKYGYLALHGTGLPEYRGWAGIAWQIINNAQKLHMRALRLDAGADSGPLICNKNGSILEYYVDLCNEKHLQEIFTEYLKVHIQSCNDIIDLVKKGEIRFLDQDHTRATYGCHRGPEDGEVDWSQDTRTIFNFIRAQSRPYPGAFTFYKKRKVILWRVRPRYDYANYSGRISGKVVNRDNKTGRVIILTGDGGIEVVEAQISGSPVQALIVIFSSIRDKCKTRMEAYLDSIHWP